MEDSSKLLYPEIEPYNFGYLQVSKIHNIYYEESGNKCGIPVVVLHGGPGSGTTPRDRRYFNPEKYRIVLFDQRGAGKSTPSYSLEENTTWDLVEDMEKLRKHLEISKWILFGTSWGCTLALIYAETHISKVVGIITGGVFTLRPEENEWVNEKSGGASKVYPDLFEKYLEPIPESEQSNMMEAYYKRLTGNDEKVMLQCAIAWNSWEMSISQLMPLDTSPETQALMNDPTWNLAHARVEVHYFMNKGFLNNPNQILDNAGIIGSSGIPVIIIQGRYDMCCPVKSAFELHKCLPNSELIIVPNAGHTRRDYANTEKFVEATSRILEKILV